MSEQPENQAQPEAMGRLWHGVDLSGLTVMLGGGTGQLARLLDEQIARADGQLLVVDFRLALLDALAHAAFSTHTTLVRARHRQAPVLAETADLLVVNGVLRQVPTSRLSAMAEELWRLMTPGGQLRVSDIVAAPETEATAAWSQRDRLVQMMGEALGQPTAIAVDLPPAARALQAAGFEGLKVALMPGFTLSEEWLENTAASIRTMVSRLADDGLRREILGSELGRLQAAFQRGGQRAAERFVVRGRKPGDLALDMEASFSEQDIWSEE